MKNPTKETDQKPLKQRFIETAREAGCDESEEAFEQTFEMIVPPKKSGAIPASKPKA